MGEDVHQNRPVNATLSKRPQHADVMAALEWKARLEGQPEQEETLREFGQWLTAHPDHGSAYDYAERYWEALSQISVDELAVDLRRPLLTERLRLRKRSASRYWQSSPLLGWARSLWRPASIMTLSSAVCIAVLAFWLWPEAAIQGKFEAQRFSTGTAELRELTLSDGSTVTLGADSTIQVEFSTQVRQVRLTAGEAYFTVVKDRERPFSVKAGELQARVVGTAFEVQHRHQTVRVGVAEGSVDVSYPVLLQLSDGGARGTGMRERRLLTAGERVNASTQAGLGKTASTDSEPVGAWRAGQFAYFDTPVLDIIADVRRYYPAKIRVTPDDALQAERVSVIFDHHDIMSLFETLQDAQVLSVQKQSDDSLDITHHSAK